LGEIQELLRLSRNPATSKADIKAKTEEKIKGIRDKIQDLGRILKGLEQLDESCDGHGAVAKCPILKALAKDDGHECHP